MAFLIDAGVMVGSILGLRGLVVPHTCADSWNGRGWLWAGGPGGIMPCLIFQR